MDRLKVFFMFSLITTLVISGCSSNEEKKASHFQKGAAYLEQGDYNSARLEYKNAVRLDPDFVAAHLKLGDTSLKLGHAQEALSAPVDTLAHAVHILLNTVERR